MPFVLPCFASPFPTYFCSHSRRGRRRQGRNLTKRTHCCREFDYVDFLRYTRLHISITGVILGARDAQAQKSRFIDGETSEGSKKMMAMGLIGLEYECNRPCDDHELMFHRFQSAMMPQCGLIPVRWNRGQTDVPNSTWS